MNNPIIGQSSDQNKPPKSNVDKNIEGDQVVDCLGSAIYHGLAQLSDVPGLLKRVIEEGFWRRRVLRKTGQIVEFASFLDFVREGPPEGLGTTLEALQRLFRDDKAALDMLDRATGQGRGGDGSQSSDQDKPLSAILGELERLRTFKQEVEKTILADWKPVDRLTEIFFRVETFDTSATSPLETSGRKIAAALHVSPTTASNSTKRLGAGNLVECHTVKHWFDRNGKEVDDPRKVDLSAVMLDRDGKPILNKKGKAIPLYHVESQSFYYVRPLPETLPELSDTDRDKSTRKREERKRERLAELESLVCPNCLAEGKWHAKCLDCGAKFTSEIEGATYESTPGETFDTSATSPEMDACTDTRQALNPPHESDVSLLCEDVQKVDIGTTNVPETGHSAFSIEEWLGRWIGADRRITRQKRETGSKGKYINLGEFNPNITNYLMGKIVYGSRPRLDDGKTWFVVADCDHTGHEQPRQGVHELAQGGISSSYFQRGHGGRLIVAFNRPVDAEMAKEFIVSLAPSLAGIKEWYPCKNGEVSRENSNLGWPLTRIAGDGSGAKVISCPLYAMDASTGEHFTSRGWLEGAEEQKVIRQALATCINSADLVPLVEEVASYAERKPTGGGG